MHKFLVTEKLIFINQHIYEAFNEQEALEKFGQGSSIAIEVKKDEHSTVTVKRLETTEVE